MSFFIIPIGCGLLYFSAIFIKLSNSKFATAIVSADGLVKLTLLMPGFDGISLSADDYSFNCDIHDNAPVDGQRTSAM